jgi:hypothetical protein
MVFATEKQKLFYYLFLGKRQTIFILQYKYLRPGCGKHGMPFPNWG